MDFGLSERETMWRDRVRSFMAAHVYPAIPVYQKQTDLEGAARWRVIPIVEELKARAFSEGLWNLFMPDERFGELPTGVFLAKDGETLTEDELREFLKANMAAFKVPVRLWQENETLPRLGTEKVDKRTLKARYLTVWESEQKSTA